MITNNLLKICNKCKEEKVLSEFYKHKIEKDGLSSICRKCKKYQDILYSKTINGKESHKIANKKYRIKNKLKRKEYNKQWLKNDPEYYNRYYYLHKKEVSRSHRKYEQRQYKINPTFRLMKNTRTRIGQAIRDNNKYSSTKNLLGADINFIRKWIESQWTDGMSWDNYGYYGWHIDHIVPVSYFNLQQSYEQKICFHWFNLQPLWAKDNFKKSDNFYVC